MSDESSLVRESARPTRLFAAGALSLLGAVVVGGMIAGVVATRRLSTHPAAVQFARVFGISVASINGLPISYAEYMDDLTLLKKFYAEQGAAGALGPNDISDQVLSRLMVTKLIAHEAKKYNVAVSDEELRASPLIAELVVPFGTREAAEAEMKARYGLTFDDYVAKVIRPVILEQKLQEAFALSTDADGAPYEEAQVRASHILLLVDDPKDDAAVKQKAEQVLKRLQGGEDFSALAKEFGSDGTKDIGGDLGWFGKGAMVPEFEEAVFAADVGLLPSVVKTQFGYHIVSVAEKRTARNYTKFMGDQLRLAKVRIMIPGVHNPFSLPPEAPAENSNT